MKALTPLLLVALLPLAGMGGADHGCNGDVIAAGAIYYDDRGNGGIWVYAETNDVEGLQSGGPSPAQALGVNNPFLSYFDSCSHANPDMMLF